MILFASNIYYHLPILLVVFSIVYSASRHDDWGLIFRESIGWLLRMVGFLGGLGVLLYVLSTHSHQWPYIMTVVGIGFAIYYYITTPFFRRKKSNAQAAAPANPAAPMSPSTVPTASTPPAK